MPTVVSKEQYFEAALDVLGESGFKALNIRALCQTLGVTSGSFYHYFGSWDGFVVQLLEWWRDRQWVALRDLAFGSGEALDDMMLIRKLTLELNHPAEAAIRAWGANNEAVRLAQASVDDDRYKTVRKTIGALVDDKQKLDVLSEFGMTMLIGYQQRLASPECARLEELLDLYFDLVRSPQR
ncbi:TetR/AcrR family transcriptional regulator [Nocardioides speluncae]|uniref:TetR/AcrR family transcriptional regulator n=1 Tax=Nocardioides speluncae TaxID=2670337 RepID=UPI000D69DBA5|nr:TetR/AcrR family transcriptional regulator [Nocardioides speluncae]